MNINTVHKRKEAAVIKPQPLISDSRRTPINKRYLNPEDRGINRTFVLDNYYLAAASFLSYASISV